MKVRTYSLERTICDIIKDKDSIDIEIRNKAIKSKEFSKENLKNAISKTFKKRDTDIEKIDNLLSEIKNSEFVKDMWTSYSKQYSYSVNIKFEEVLNVIEKIKELVK